MGSCVKFLSAQGSGGIAARRTASRSEVPTDAACILQRVVDHRGFPPFVWTSLESQHVCDLPESLERPTLSALSYALFVNQSCLLLDGSRGFYRA